MAPGPDVTEERPTSTFMLEQEVIKTRLTELYKHLYMAGNPDLVNLSRFRFKSGFKGATIFEFYDDKRKWVSLTKQGGGFYAESRLKNLIGAKE